MNNFLQTILQSVMQNGGQGQVVDFALNWIFQQPKAIAFCKMANWDIAHLKEAIKGGISYVSNAYSQRQPFAKTIQQRNEDVVKIFTELQGFACLDDTERKVLAAKMAGFNAREAWEGLNLQNSMSVEQVIQVGNSAQEKYLNAAKLAGVGASSNSVEESAKVDLNSVLSAAKISGGKPAA